MRAYRAAPGAVAVLAPVPIAARPVLERAHEALAGLQARLPGRSGTLTETSMSQVAAAGGARGVGTAALAKALAICAGTVGGAAVCIGAGVVPTPLGIDAEHTVRPHLERVADSVHPEARNERVATPAPESVAEPAEATAPEPVEDQQSLVTASAAVAEPAESASAPESTPLPEPPPAPSSTPATTQTAGSAAGEFGP